MALAAACALSGSAQAWDYVPVYNATLMGGQYFFKSDKANLSGNASAVAAPTFARDDQWSFIPMLASNYQGTKGVNDTVAAGTLFEQQMDHRASFMAIDAVPGTKWKLKPSVSYKREFLKETKDETWGHGLFDYDKIAAGFEAENLYKEPFSYRFGLDIFKVRYMNYQSLESQTGTDPLGNPLGRENAGANVLNTYNYQLSFAATRPYPFDDPAVALTGSYSLLLQDYYNEHLVDNRGQLLASTRKDVLQTVAGSIGYPRELRWFDNRERLSANFGMSLAYNHSNQNSFDVAATQFTPDSYSYFQFGMGPSASVSWGDEKQPASVGASLQYLRTNYYGRLTQDSNAVYTGNKQFQDRWQAGINYGYPLGTGLTLKAQINLLWARSNNHFESTYSYNYTTANYLMGVTWEY